MKINNSVWLGMCCAVLFVLNACDEEPAVLRVEAYPNVTAWHTYCGDIEVRKDKISASVKKPDVDDAKAAAGIGGRFPTAISTFDEAGLVTLSGGVTADGFGASGTRSYYPDKYNSTGTKLKHTIRDYSAKCSGHPKVGGFGMLIKDGFVTFKLKGGSKPGDSDYFNWKQYVPMLQAMLGIFPVKDGHGTLSAGITTQITINATMSISVSGWSAKHKAVIGETHTISSPILFSAKNGKITLALPGE